MLPEATFIFTVHKKGLKSNFLERNIFFWKHYSLRSQTFSKLQTLCSTLFMGFVGSDFNSENSFEGYENLLHLQKNLDWIVFWEVSVELYGYFVGIFFDVIKSWFHHFCHVERIEQGTTLMTKNEGEFLYVDLSDFKSGWTFL